MLQANGDKSGIKSSSSHDSVLTDNEESFGQTEDSPPAHGGHSPSYKDDNVFTHDQNQNHQPSPVINLHTKLHPTTSTPADSVTQKTAAGMLSPSLRRAASERFRGAKNFLKRMESLKVRKTKRPTRFPGEKLEISGPTLVETPEIQERIDTLGCVEISPSLDSPPLSGIPWRVKNTSESSECHNDTSNESKRSGRVFQLDNSSRGSGSNANSDSEDSTSHNTPSTVCSVAPSPPIGYKRNHSSSDLLEQHLKPEYKSESSYPRLAPNGYIEMGDGNQLNCRTGSFNLGSSNEGENFKVHLRNRSCQGLPVSTDKSSSSANAKVSENRLSVYDNVPASESDPQRELDLVLRELFKNISGLNESLAQVSLGTRKFLI